MENKKEIKVLLAHRNLDFCMVLREYLSLQQDMVCCGVCRDGKAVLESLEQRLPDVVVMGLWLPMVDGFEVLAQCREHPGWETVHFIVCDSFCKEYMVRLALQRGADCFLPQPFSNAVLVQRIRMLCESAADAPLTNTDNEKRDFWRKQLKRLELPAHLCGSRYVNDMILLMLESEQRITLKDAYDKVAQRNQTGADCVENAIKTCVHAVQKAPAAFVLQIFNKAGLDGPLSNGRFLATIVNDLRAGQENL